MKVEEVNSLRLLTPYGYDQNLKSEKKKAPEQVESDSFKEMFLGSLRKINEPYNRNQNKYKGGTNL